MARITTMQYVLILSRMTVRDSNAHIEEQGQRRDSYDLCSLDFIYLLPIGTTNLQQNPWMLLAELK